MSHQKMDRHKILSCTYVRKVSVSFNIIKVQLPCNSILECVNLQYPLSRSGYSNWFNCQDHLLTLLLTADDDPPSFLPNLISSYVC